jgi:riboflavin synthase
VLRIAPASGGDLRLQVGCSALTRPLGVGDSVAVNGVCLTALEPRPDAFWCDVSRETLACTTLGTLGAGDRVNLEPALTLQTPLGGHLVSGHVDGIGTVLARHAEARSVRFSFEAPEPLARYIAPKGAVCIDGVSLTVNEVDARCFGVNIVPHTLEATTIGTLAIGDRVNLEADMVARYLERLLNR